MIVPQFWAEAKVKDRVGGSQVTIKRFGWSDISEDDAKVHAQTRAQEAMERVRAGEKIRKLEHKIAYNGAEGLPIREEVIERHGDVVITRNSYGALCLNTPNILFSDIDFDENDGPFLSPKMLGILTIISLVVWYFSRSGMVFFAVLCSSIVLSGIITRQLFKRELKKKGGYEGIVKSAVERFVAKHPEAHLRLYRTPMGYRVLAMHRTFDPGSEESLEFMKELDSDPVYMQMCRNQKCFRARISPKPWRIGMKRPGSKAVWPIKQETMTARQEWVARYTEKARAYASCRFEKSYGSSFIDPAAEFVRAIHDEACRADRQAAIA